MTMTWRQMEAYREFNEVIDCVDRTYDLLVNTVGSQGDKQTIEKTFKELTPK